MIGKGDTMNYQWTAVREGMDVTDINGDKVGSVGEIFSRAGVASSTTTTSMDTSVSASGNYLKVDTGFLGLGKDLYIPAEYVSDVVDNKVRLNTSKDAIDSFGWDEKPAFLDHD